MPVYLISFLFGVKNNDNNNNNNQKNPCLESFGRLFGVGGVEDDESSGNDADD